MTVNLSGYGGYYIWYENMWGQPLNPSPGVTPKIGKNWNLNNTWLIKGSKTNENYILIGLSEQLGHYKIIFIQKCQSESNRGPENPYFGPKNCPKWRFLVIMAQKRPQTNENRIWIGFSYQIWYSGAIGTQRYKNSKTPGH